MKLEDVLVRLDEGSLQRFLNKSIIGVLKINRESIRLEKLVDLILKNIPKDVILNESRTRTIIIKAMHDHEVENLAKFIDLKYDGDIRYALITQKFKKKLLIKYIEFFDGIYEHYEIKNVETYESIGPKRYLFPHQLITIKKTMDLLEKQPHRVLLHMPTGAGKTISAIRIIITELLKNPSALIIWLAHNEELCEQALSEFKQSWELAGDRKIDVYRFYGLNKLDLLQIKTGFISASLQKMIYAAKSNNTFLSELGQNTNFVVIDEAHMATADKFSIVIDELAQNKNTKLLGLSATPGRKSDTYDDENRKLANFFSSNKITLETNEENPIDFLTHKGYLAKPKFEFIKYNGNLSDKDISAIRDGIDIPNSILQKLSEDDKRNIRIITEIERLSTIHKKIIVFASTVEHAFTLSLLLSSRVHNSSRVHSSSYVTSKTPIKIRREILDRYKNSDEPMIICNYGILTMGFDAPKTSAVVIARPTKSYILYAQMVGRAIRGPKAGGNVECTVSTLIDNDINQFITITEIFKQWESVWNER